MFWVLVVGIILIGFLFILAEVLFVPGGVLGAIGGIVLLYGIYLPYSVGETTGGHITLFTTLVLLTISLFMAIRSQTWKKIQLDKVIDSNVKNKDTETLKIGDQGVATSRLNPMGTVRFDNKYVEVTTFDTFTNEGEDVEIIKIEKNKIIVKQIN
jgi:membrane-bound ClpP family serine protease